MGSVLDLRFTDPAAPLFIGVEGDESECLFVISTSQIQGSTNAHPQANPRLNVRKRTLHDVPGDDQQTSAGSSGSQQLSERSRGNKVKRSMKAALRTDATPGTASSSAAATSQVESRGSDFDYAPPSSFVPVPGRSVVSQQNRSLDDFYPVPELLGHVGDTDFDVDMEAHRPSPAIDRPDGRKAPEPLFYPSSPGVLYHTPQPDRAALLSQVPRAREKATQELNLGGEYATEGEEVEMPVPQKGEGTSSLELFEDEFGPTQEGDREGRKVRARIHFFYLLTDLIDRLFSHSSRIEGFVELSCTLG